MPGIKQLILLNEFSWTKYLTKNKQIKQNQRPENFDICL